MNGVLAEDAQTAETLFGGSARVSKEGGHTQDLANSTRPLAVNARMELCTPCIKKKDPKGTEGGQGGQSRGNRAWLLSPAGAVRGRGDTQKGGSRSVVAATSRRTIFQAVTFP